MLLVRAIIRPNKVGEVLEKLQEAGYPAVTKMDVYGRGKQKGIKVGGVFYDELPKEMLLIVIQDSEKDDVINIIMDNARTGEDGNNGDGRIFVSEIDEAYTVSTKSKE